MQIPLLMSRHLVLSLALLVSLIPIVSPVHIRPATPHHIELRRVELCDCSSILPVYRYWYHELFVPINHFNG